MESTQRKNGTILVWYSLLYFHISIQFTFSYQNRTSSYH